jgi:hypothetical protein
MVRQSYTYTGSNAGVNAVVHSTMSGNTANVVYGTYSEATNGSTNTNGDAVGVLGYSTVSAGESRGIEGLASGAATSAYGVFATGQSTSAAGTSYYIR